MHYLITWHTYGTWLPGDDRGWRARKDVQPVRLQTRSRDRAFVMNNEQRGVVDSIIREHCEIRQWRILALNVRTNHVHLVCTADHPPEKILGECKAWASRRLRERTNAPERIWSRHGSTRYLKTEASLQRAIEYVLYEQ